MRYHRPTKVCSSIILSFVGVSSRHFSAVGKIDYVDRRSSKNLFFLDIAEPKNDRKQWEISISWGRKLMWCYISCAFQPKGSSPSVDEEVGSCKNRIEIATTPRHIREIDIPVLHKRNWIFGRNWISGISWGRKNKHGSKKSLRCILYQ